MTCVELQESLIENENGGTSAQRAHLKDCPHCSALVADLLVIACAAGELRAAEDPSPRVWNSIEAALRREGIIKPQRAGRSLLPSFSSSWSWARWALPVAAAILVAIGIAVRPHNGLQPPVADNVPHTATTDAEATMVGLNDNDLLAEIAEQAPALQAQYTDNLRRVNEYIRDARESLVANPNDEEARRALMDACQEKAMLFELALDRSLP
ncbi:MAG TPA: anti-sigma factor [Candidatus Sulfotelmatobacter sp.]|nr:anti-sigma factor [Candidatus Sulfotelmatobacter sp.]